MTLKFTGMIVTIDLLSDNKYYLVVIKLKVDLNWFVVEATTWIAVLNDASVTSQYLARADEEMFAN